METLFLQISKMSMSASWLIIAVVLIRLILKKAPKGFRYVLWALVAVRLLCPVFIESDFSFVPKQNVSVEIGENNDAPIPMEPIMPEENQAPQDQTSQNQTPQNQSPQNQTSHQNVRQDINQTAVMAWIWLGGIVTLCAYAVISYGKLRNTIRTAIKKEDNLWLCDDIHSPFILGLRKPQIYLPSYIEENHIPYIVAHEKEHVRYKDNWWKPLGFILLTIHWLNPLVWVAYILMCKDIELACDERVICAMNVDDKKNYSKSLLLCSNPKHFISACPVAFGEVGVKERIKKIIDYRKPSVWMIGVGIVICLIMAIGFLTNPKTETKDVAKIEIRSGSNGHDVDITDPETIKKITDDINSIIFVPFRIVLPAGGWSYEITWYDANGNEIDSMLLIGDYQIKETYFYYLTLNKRFDTDFYDELLLEDLYQMEETPTTESNGELSQSEIDWFSTQFFNNDDRRIVNMFLTSEYSSPKYINLGYLFYGGSYGYEEATVSQDEENLLKQRYDAAIELDVSKVTRKTMNAILQRYLNMSLEETALVNLKGLYYLEEYDAYYRVAGDTKMSQYTIVKGWKDESGKIVLEYYDALNGDESQMWRVTLESVQGNYCFVSNVNISGKKEGTGDVPENSVSKEQLEWFATEFFNDEENRITNHFLNDIYGFSNEVNLYELFYNGVDTSGVISEEEKELLLERYVDEIHTDVVRITTAEMNAVLEKYLGLSLDETSKVGLDKMYYLEEYDAYYTIHGDTHYKHYVLEAGRVNADGTITLQYHSDDIRCVYWVTLIERDGTYQFLTNYLIDSERY